MPFMIIIPIFARIKKAAIIDPFHTAIRITTANAALTLLCLRS